MARPRLTRLFAVLLVMAASSAGISGSPAQSSTTSASIAAPAVCRWAARGYDANLWLGGAGAWSDATRWSKQQVPGLATRDYACIPEGSDVVLDATSPRVDLDLLELGLGAHLTLRRGTALFLWGDQDVVRSISKRGSVIEVDGATLGGPGRLHVIGTLDMHSSSTGSRAILTTRPDDSSYVGLPGILEIGDEGLLDLRGSDPIRLSKQYVVDVHGKARMLDDSGLVADNGTAFMLQKHYFGRGLGKLVILNGGDFVQGAADGIKVAATFVNRGRIALRGPGDVAIQGRYFGAGKTTGDFGGGVGSFLIPPVIVQSTQSSGDDTSAQDPQVASIQIPAIDPDGAKTDIAPLDAAGVVGAVGVPMKVHARGLLANVADPAVIELRYDASLFEGNGAPPADPTLLTVAHADGSGAKYDDVPPCLGRGAMPLGATACVDLVSSRTEGDGDVIIVVRTLETSRWVAH